MPFVGQFRVYSYLGSYASTFWWKLAAIDVQRGTVWACSLLDTVTCLMLPRGPVAPCAFPAEDAVLPAARRLGRR